MNTPTTTIETSQHSPLRQAFEEKISKNNEQNDDVMKTKLGLIESTLDAGHKEKVHAVNQSLKDKFGSILLLVNYHDSQLIDRLWGWSLGAVDIQDGVIAFIMGYSESVQGHGVRYLSEYGVCKDGKIVSTWPMTYRGAYASETDHREKAYNSIKIISVEGDIVTFGVQSAQQLLIKERNTKTNSFTTKESHNLAEEQRMAEEKKLSETLTTGRKENMDNIRKLISAKSDGREDIEDPFITDTFAIFPVVKYDQSYDASDRSYKLYIVGDIHPEPTLLYQARCNYSPRTSGKFFRNKARFSDWQVEGEILKTRIIYKHGDYSSTPGHVYTLSEETVNIPLTKK